MFDSFWVLDVEKDIRKVERFKTDRHRLFSEIVGDKKRDCDFSKTQKNPDQKKTGFLKLWR